MKPEEVFYDSTNPKHNNGKVLFSSLSKIISPLYTHPTQSITCTNSGRLDFSGNVNVKDDIGIKRVEYPEHSSFSEVSAIFFTNDSKMIDEDRDTNKYRIKDFFDYPVIKSNVVGEVQTCYKSPKDSEVVAKDDFGLLTSYRVWNYMSSNFISSNSPKYVSTYLGDGFYQPHKDIYRVIENDDKYYELFHKCHPKAQQKYIVDCLNKAHLKTDFKLFHQCPTYMTIRKFYQKWFSLYVDLDDNGERYTCHLPYRLFHTQTLLSKIDFSQDMVDTLTITHKYESEDNCHQYLSIPYEAFDILYVKGNKDFPIEEGSLVHIFKLNRSFLGMIKSVLGAIYADEKKKFCDLCMEFRHDKLFSDLFLNEDSPYFIYKVSNSKFISSEIIHKIIEVIDEMPYFVMIDAKTKDIYYLKNDIFKIIQAETVYEDFLTSQTSSPSFNLFEEQNKMYEDFTDISLAPENDSFSFTRLCKDTKEILNQLYGYLFTETKCKYII